MGSATFTPASAPIFTPVQLTITLANTTASSIGIVNLTDALPKSPFGQMSVAQNFFVQNTCQGVFHPAAGDVTLHLSGGLVPANSSCTFSVTVVTSALGLYTDAAVTFAGDPSSTTFSWARSNFTPVAPSSDHVFVPVASPGEVLVYNGGVQGNAGGPTCTMTSSYFSDPTIVATSPFTGDIYVYDQSRNTINVVKETALCQGGSTSVVVTPYSSFVPAWTTATGMTIDWNGELVVTGNSGNAFGCACSGAKWYNTAGNLLAALQSSVNANFYYPEADVADKALWIEDTEGMLLNKYDTSGATPVFKNALPRMQSGAMAFGDLNLFQGFSVSCSPKFLGEVDDVAGPSNWSLVPTCGQAWSTGLVTVDAMAFDPKSSDLAVLTRPLFNAHVMTPQINYWIDSSMNGNTPPYGHIATGLPASAASVGQFAYGW